MNDRVFYIAAAAVTVLIIALSLVWPQGEGKPSLPPFGHAIQQPDYYRMLRERDERRVREAQQKAADAKRDAALHAAADSSSSAAPPAH
ncbi:MAG: hypothetical protein ACXU8O_07880 [Asticcacaulis sp.]